MIECTGIIKVLTPPLYIYIYIGQSITRTILRMNQKAG